MTCGSDWTSIALWFNVLLAWRLRQTTVKALLKIDIGYRISPNGIVNR